MCHLVALDRLRFDQFFVVFNRAQYRNDSNVYRKTSA